MKTPWIAAAGALLAIALAAFFLTRPDGPAAQDGKPGSSNSGKGKPGSASAQSPDGRRLRKQTKEASEADKKAAADLELLWAHGDQKETLDALDKIGDHISNVFLVTSIQILDDAAHLLTTLQRCGLE